MADHHITPAYTPEPHFSTSCPANQAMYLHSLIKAAAQLVDDLEGSTPLPAKIGLPALLTVISERADDLSQALEWMDEVNWAHAEAAVRARRENHLSKDL